MNRKKRLLLFFVINISLLLCAIFLVLFANFVSETPLAKITDCPAHKLLGIYCPLCGGTRAIGCLLRGKIVASLIYNPAVLPATVAFIIYDILCFKAIIQDKKEIIKIHKPVWISLVVLLILNWIFRNVVLIGFDMDYISLIS